jgi:hypothetical protein
VKTKRQELTELTPLDVQLEDLDWFAKEMIPAFRDTRTAAAAE